MQTFLRICPPTGWAMGHDPSFWYPVFKILRKMIKVYVPGEGIHFERAYRLVSDRELGMIFDRAYEGK